MKCPYCNKEAQWVTNEKIYGKRYGKSYMCYLCETCNAYVGCHNNTKIPLGTMANKELRNWRIKSHSVIDPLWRGKKVNRQEVYDKLKSVFGKEIHIGKADIELCKNIIKLFLVYFNTNPPIFS